MILSDRQIEERLRAALSTLGSETAETLEGKKVLQTARKALTRLSAALTASHQNLTQKKSESI